MSNFNTLRKAAMASIAVAAFTLPTLAQAQVYGNYYDANAECRSKENDAQVIGGLIGAVIGGVAGSQVSGNGARTEGSAVGAVLGGLAGAAIGDESVNCDKARRRAYNTTSTRQPYAVTSYPTRTRTRTRTYDDRRYQNGYQTTTYPYQNQNQNYGNQGYNNQGYGNGNAYGQQNRKTRRKLRDVRRRLQGLRVENRQLERELGYGYNPRVRNRLDWVCGEIARLEKKERRLKRRLRRANY